MTDEVFATISDELGLVVTATRSDIVVPTHIILLFLTTLSSFKVFVSSFTRPEKDVIDDS